MMGELRAFVARVVGYERPNAIEHALRSISLYVSGHAALVLLGNTNLMPIAVALHRRAIGADRPFVVADPVRPSGRATVRSPRSCRAGVDAVQVARGGSLCMRRHLPPRDLSATAALVRDPASDVRLVIVAEASYVHDPFLLVPSPIWVPPLTARGRELSRIVEEYGADAIAALGAEVVGLRDVDRTWILRNAAGSLSEIEQATLRLIALRASASAEQAAQRLKMSGAALRQWIRCRKVNWKR